MTACMYNAGKIPAWAKYVLILLFAIGLVKTSMAQYCAATGTGCSDSNGVWIQSVKVGTLFNKVSPPCDPMGPSGYSDYTSDTIKLPTDSVYNMLIKLDGLQDEYDNVKAFCDWNKDGDFEDVGEELPASRNQNLDFRVNIKAPAGFTAGTVTRLRVRDHWLRSTEIVDACDSTQYGEVEDYSIQIGTPEVLASGPYCSVMGECDSSAWINEVKISGDGGSGFDKTSSCGYYSDYTDSRVTMSTGNNYTAVVKGTLSSVSIYIDWNNDYQFDQNTETYQGAKPINTNFAGDSILVNISPSGNIETGYKRMRVSSAAQNVNLSFEVNPGGASNTTGGPACDSTDGEVEDYTVLFIAPLDTVPSCVDGSQSSPNDGQQNLCQRTVISWPKVTYAQSYKFTLMDGPIVLANNVMLSDTFYLASTPYNVGNTYSWIAIPVTAGGKEGIGCDTLNFTVSPNQDPSVNILPATANQICKGDNLPLDGTPINGTSPFKFSWIGTDDSLLTDTAIANPVFSNTADTGLYKYSLKVWDDNGCMAVDSVSISVLPQANPGSTTVSNNNVCEGSQVVLQLTGKDGSVSWEKASSSAGPWADVVLTSINDSTFQTAALSDTVFFRAKVSKGICFKYGNIIEVKVKPKPAKPIVNATSQVICSGQTAILTVTNYTADIEWNDAVNTQGVRLEVTSSGVYIATATVNGCTSSSDPKQVQVNPGPAKPIITVQGSNPFCEGNSVMLFSNTGANSVWSNGESGSSINVFLAGNYWVTETNSSGCSNTSDQVTIVVNPLPPTPTIVVTGNQPYCSGQTIYLESSSMGNNRWNTGEESDQISVTQSGDYSVTVMNGFGCKATSAVTSISFFDSPPVPVISIDKQVPHCEGDVLNLISSSSSGNMWSTGASTQSIRVVSEGQFSVTVTNGDGCSMTSSIVSVHFNPVPPTPIIDSDPLPPFCEGTTVVLTSNINGGNHWSTGSDQNDISINSSGTYTLVNVNEFGCSSPEVSYTAVFEALPSRPEVVQDVDTLRAISNGIKYQWFDENGPINGAVFSDYHPIKSGTYWVVAYSANRCESEPSAYYQFSGTGFGKIAVSGNRLEVFPNPSKGRLTIKGLFPNGADFAITDINGRKVIEGKLTKNEMEIESCLSPGIYLLSIQDEGQVERIKINIE